MHLAASLLYAGGLSLDDIAAYLGHSDRSITERTYARHHHRALAALEAAEPKSQKVMGVDGSPEAPESPKLAELLAVGV